MTQFPPVTRKSPHAWRPADAADNHFVEKVLQLFPLAVVIVITDDNISHLAISLLDSSYLQFQSEGSSL